MLEITSTPMLALKQPYGIWADEYVKVKITRHGGMLSYEETADLLDLFGTYVHAVKKIYNCLKYSGQYECHLQQNWFVNMPNIVRWCFAIVDMDLVIEDVKGTDLEDLVDDFNSPVCPRDMRRFLSNTESRRGEDTEFALWLKDRFKEALKQGEKAL